MKKSHRKFEKNPENCTKIRPIDARKTQKTKKPIKF